MKSSKFVTLLGLVGMTFGMASCGGNTSSAAATSSAGETSTQTSTQTSTETSSQAATKTEIVVGSPSAQKTWVEARVNAWLTAQGLDSKYTVTMYELGEGDVNSKVTDWTAGPDIYAYASDQTLGLVGKGALAKVPTAYATEMKTALGNEAMVAAQIGTSYYGYPYAGDNGYFLYYNKSVFTDTSKLEKLTDVVDVCTAANLKLSYKLADTFFSTGVMFSFGARYDVALSADSKSIEAISADFNSEKGVKAIKAMKDIINNTGIDTTTDGQKAPTVANGLGACVDGGWNASNYKEALGDDYGCCKLPSVTVGTETVNLGSFLGYKLYGVNPSRTGTTTEKLSDLHKLANYLISKDVQEKRFDDLTIVPTNAEVKALSKVQETPHVKALADQSAYAVAQTIVPGHVWDTATNPYALLLENTDATDEEIQAMATSYNTAVCTL